MTLRAVVERTVERLRSLPPGARLVVLAGPGVIASNAVEGLRALAAAGGLGVVNTWGAKGVFDWQSPHHLGTAGLQEDDFALAGLAHADLILATGLDTHEAPPERWRLAPSLTVPPRALAPLAEVWPLAVAEPERPPLYGRLAEIVGPLYFEEKVPLSPARVIMDLKAALPPGGAVFADPGPAGFWIARSFPTSELGSVVVPAVRERGGATWRAVDAARRGRPVVAVVTSPMDLESDEAIAWAVTVGLPLVVEVWGEGRMSAAAEHGRLLGEALASGRVQVLPVPVDWSDTDRLIEVAGPVIAWGGL